MDISRIALPVIAASIAAGLLVAFPPQMPDMKNVRELIPEAQEKAAAGSNTSLEYGSTHEHALFYVVVNGTELSFREAKYQLNSRYVHIENNRSHIIHKHAKGVTWNYFLDTINVSVNQTGENLCVSLPDKKYCGEGRIALEDGSNLTAEIQQGDNLVIVLQGDVNATVEEYIDRQLPPMFKPQSSRGYGV